MKTRLTVLALLAGGFLAAEPAQAVIVGGEVSSTITADPGNNPQVRPEPIRLPYGVGDILKLTQAKVSDDIIITYIQTTPTVYQLGPKEIVYLRDQGVSNPVITAMLEQRRRAAENPARQPAAPQTRSYPDTAQQQPPPVTYIEQPAPASSVYVIPSTPNYYYADYPYYSYSYSYPYYSPYFYSSYRYCAPYRYYGCAPYGRGYVGFGGPSLAFNFGFGGGGRFGGSGHFGSSGHFGGGTTHFTGGSGHFAGGGHTGGGHSHR